MCERAYHAAIVAVQGMSFESAITIILTALGVMLAVVTLGIGGLAIWGYFGIRDSVKDMATKKVDDAMAEALKKYPAAADMFKILQRLRDQADLMDQLRNQVVTSPDPKSVAITSKPVVQGEQPETPLESVSQQVTPIEKYPGQEGKDASGS
jgi:hypothetical protein